MFEQRTAGAVASVNRAVLHSKQGDRMLGRKHSCKHMGAEYGHGIMFANGLQASNSRPCPAAERAAFSTLIQTTALIKAGRNRPAYGQFCVCCACRRRGGQHPGVGLDCRRLLLRAGARGRHPRQVRLKCEPR